MSPHLVRCLLSSFLLTAGAMAAEAEAPMKKEGPTPAPAGAAPADEAKPATEATPAKPAMAEKPAEAAPAKPAAEGEMKKGEEKETKAEDPEAVTITPFRAARLPSAKETRTFHLAKLNKPLAFETTRELQRLFSAFASQHLVDGATGEFSKAPGSMTTIAYTIVQDLGENRFLAKGNWPALNGDPLLEGKDSLVVLLLDKPVEVGAAGRCTGLHVGMVALGFTAKFAPLEGKKLTLRREAFLQCTPVDESAGAMQKFVEAINRGAELSVVTTERISCKACGGLGFTREAQKGKIEDKRTPCKDCEGTGKLPLVTETKFAP
jgi:hypothetical protein